MPHDLLINRSDTAVHTVEHETDHGLAEGHRVEQKVYGREMNLVYARRSADYHTDPHVHVAEQLNYCVEGRVWIFVEDEAYLMVEGDFTRIPPHAIHWARGETENVLLTAHGPPLVADDPDAEGLFLPDEDASPREKAANEFIDEYPYDLTEEEMMAAFFEAFLERRNA